MSNSLLSVKNLLVKISGKTIVDNVSFDVKKGETLVVLGPNGAGKTTLLRAILGIIPFDGKVVWNAKNISYLPPNELVSRREMLPLTVYDFFSLKNISKRKADKSLVSVGLSSSLSRMKISDLSTGQFQRISIAWALADSPDMLIFDEPTSGIDIGGAETVYSLLHKYWEKTKLSIILVTHDLSIVWGHADNVLCLNKKGVCYGSPEMALTDKKLKELYGMGVKYHKH